MHNLTTERAKSIVRAIAPGYELVSVKSAFGSFTNDVRILSCVSPEGHVRRLVVKFMVDQPEYSARNAVAHYYSLKLVREHNNPAPEPLYMDETGQILGIPGLVMGFIPGNQVAAPTDAEVWARAQAQMLLRIHSIRPNQTYRDKLFDGNEQTLYYLDGDVRQKQKRNPLAADIVAAVEELVTSLTPTGPVLVHLDYWHGNVLWEGDEMSAIVDWDFAGYGDPAIDVAYFRMNMHLRGIKEAADIFLDEYETGSGKKLHNLGFRELGAAAQALPDPLLWVPAQSEMGGKPVSDDVSKANYVEFVRGALVRAYAGC